MDGTPQRDIHYQPSPDERRKQRERHEGIDMLIRPENEWARQYIDLYLDVKDHGRGTSIFDLPRNVQDAFRIIRQATAGSLGNPPIEL